jgi:hypothetical protein
MTSFAQTPSEVFLDPTPIVEFITKAIAGK